MTAKPGFGGWTRASRRSAVRSSPVNGMTMMTRILLMGLLTGGLALPAATVSGQHGSDPSDEPASDRAARLLPRPPASPSAPVRQPYLPVTDARLRDPEPESWLMYRRTYDGWGYSPLSQIDSSNVADLTPVWGYRVDPDDGRVQAPPIVNGEAMFVTTAEQVVALDAATGVLRWRYIQSLPPDVRRPHSTNRGVALYDDMVYVGTLDAQVVALDAVTGEVVWQRTVADYRQTYYITMAPLVVRGRVMVGTSGGEHGVRGAIVALDAATGEEIWRQHTIPAPGEAGSATWSGDTWRTGGAPVWLTGTYDPDFNLTYWGVGNGSPWTGDTRPGDNLYTNSTIALDADSGAIRSHYQYHWNGSWDWDEANAPLLVNLERGGRTLPVLVHPAKNGFLWLLAREGGIRFLEAHPFVHQDVFTGLDPVSGRPAYDDTRVPGIGKRAQFCPSFVGARDWRPEAFSPQTGLLYVPAINNLCSVMEGKAVQYEAGRPFFGAAVDVFKQEGAEHVGELQAWNLDTGQREWTREFPTRSGSLLATAGELVFFDTGGRLHAFDARRGDLLWRYALDQHGAGAVPVSYAVRGVQYVAVQFEARGSRVDIPGNPSAGSVVVAFALNCQC